MIYHLKQIDQITQKKKKKRKKKEIQSLNVQKKKKEFDFKIGKII